MVTLRRYMAIYIAVFFTGSYALLSMADIFALYALYCVEDI